MSTYTYAQYSLAYILAYMEFTTLIIMVGHLDPDTPLTNVGETGGNCGIRHVTVPIATRILIANVRHIGLSNICVINLVYFKMQV